MSLFVSEIVTPPASLPLIATDAALAAAVVEEIERTILWRAVVRQERRILIDGALPSRIEIEPVTAITSLTRWTPDNDAEVIDAADYMYVSRDPAGTIIVPHHRDGWPAPERAIGSFQLDYEAGWQVTPESSPGAGDGVNEVPAAILFMIDRAVAFRRGSGVGDLSIGTLKISVADSYSTDALPREITNIARAWAYRPGLFTG